MLSAVDRLLNYLEILLCRDQFWLFSSLATEFNRDPFIFHYITEIMRYFNKINFVDKKILRSIKFGNISKILPQKLRYFLIYRFFWEKATKSKLIKETNDGGNFTEGSSSKAFDLFFNRMKTFDWNIALRGKKWLERESIEHAFPTFFLRALIPHFERDKLHSLLKSMNLGHPSAKVTVRIVSPPSACNKEIKRKFLSYLKDRKIDFVPDSDFSDVFHVNASASSDLVKSRFYRQHSIIFQDKSSLIAVSLLAAQPKDKICDLCAAPGMKTHLIAQNTEYHSQITALDFHGSRTKSARDLLKKLGAPNVNLLHADGINPPLKSAIFDRVLVDAPCTGSGTLYKHPELKWRQNVGFLKQNIIIQKKLLESAVGLLKLGGILVYSTCSLYKQEGEDQIIDLLEKFQLEPQPMSSMTNPCYLKGYTTRQEGSGMARTFPDETHEGAFFFAKFKKL